MCDFSDIIQAFVTFNVSYKGITMTKNTKKDSGQLTTTAVTIKTDDSMLSVEDSIEMEMNKLKDILRQKAVDGGMVNKDSVSDNNS